MKVVWIIAYIFFIQKLFKVYDSNIFQNLCLKYVPMVYGFTIKSINFNHFHLQINYLIAPAFKMKILRTNTLLLVFILYFSFSLSLNLNLHQHKELHESISTISDDRHDAMKNNHVASSTENGVDLEQTFQHHNQFHYTASSMRINYSQQILKLNSNLSPAADLNDRIDKIQKYYLGHQEQVQLLGNFTSASLDTSSITCKETPTDTIQSLTHRTTQIKKYIQNALNTNSINFISNQQQKKQTKEALQREIIYLNALQKFFQSGCTNNVRIEQTHFVSNPNANNWILGDWTYDQFIRSYIETMKNQKKVTKCPTDKPYFDSSTNECINCEYPKNLWDMKESECTSCPYDQIVNLKTRKCVSEIHYLNNIMDESNAWITSQDDLTQVNAQFNKDKLLQNSVVCPFNTPFIINEKCSICSQGFVYLLEEKRCTAIPFHMKYDRNLHKVVQNLDSYQTNQYVSSNFQDNLKECPSRYPYFDNITCVDCQFPRFFNERRKFCEPCFNLDFCGPKKVSFVTNSLASNLVGDDPLQVRNYLAQNAELIKDNSTTECALNTPFYASSQRKCIACPLNTFFNVNSFTCVQCPQGTTYNKLIYFCQGMKGVKTNSKANYLIVHDITKYKQQQSKIQGPQCSQNKPYFNGNECIKCESKQLFNTSSKACTACPQNTTYNPISFNCQILTFKTNSLTDRLWVDDLALYQKLYKDNNGEQCPTQLPFYNGNRCMKCLQQEIFNTSSLNCTICPSGATFDNINKNCSGSRVTYVSNLKYGVPPYYTSNKTKLLQDYDAAIKSGTEVCPFSKPFFNGRECIVCTKSDEYFNIDTKKCQNCIDSYKFNSIINECQQDPTKSYTSLSSKNLIFDGQPISYYQYKRDQSIKAGATQCPTNTPYYTKNNKCEACNSPKEYFNLLRRICTQCQQKSSYVAIDHECETPIGDIVTPEATLQKSLANLFT